MAEPERIKVPIGGGKYLIVERNPDPSYDREIYIFIETNGAVSQDIALIRPSYRYKPDDQLDWSEKTVDVIVWADDFSSTFAFDSEVMLFLFIGAPCFKPASVELVIRFHDLRMHPVLRVQHGFVTVRDVGV